MTECWSLVGETDEYPRGCMPKKETKWQKRERVARERFESTEYLKYRIADMANCYNIHMEDIFNKEVVRKIFPDVDEIKQGIRRDSFQVDGDRCLQLDQGGVVGSSKALGQQFPKCFVRSTKVASWRAFRFHNAEGPLNATVAGRMPHSPAVTKHQDSGSSFRDFVNLVSHAMVQTTQKEMQMKGRSRRGSFFLLTPYERSQLNKALHSSLVSKHFNYDSGAIRKIHGDNVCNITAQLAEERLAAHSPPMTFKGKKPLPGASVPHFARSQSTSPARFSDGASTKASEGVWSEEEEEGQQGHQGREAEGREDEGREDEGREDEARSEADSAGWQGGSPSVGDSTLQDTDTETEYTDTAHTDTT